MTDVPSFGQGLEHSGIDWDGTKCITDVFVTILGFQGFEYPGPHIE